MRRACNWIRSGLLVGVASWAGMACAESPAPTTDTGAAGATSNQIQEIVVTAEKRAEKVFNVPMSVTALTGGQLAERGVTQVADLDRVVPGFTYRPSNFGTPVYSIRGIGFFENTVTVAPAVSVYVDQVPLPYSVMTEGAPLDIERVEVLKGPQGTLFGQNSTGGAINYIAAKPTNTFATGGNVGYGNYNAEHAEGFVSGPVTDTLRARLFLTTDRRGDWQKSQTRDATLGARDFSAGRAMLDWRPNESLFLELSLSRWVDKSDTQAAQFVAFSPLKPTGYKDVVPALEAYQQAPDDNAIADWNPDTSFRQDENLGQTALHVDWAITPDITATSLSSFAAFHQFAPIDSDGTAIENSQRTLNTTIHTVSQELRLSGDLAAYYLRWMIGGNYEHDRTGDNEFTRTDATNDGIGARRYYDYIDENNQTIDTAAAFSSLDYAVTHAVTAEGSVRYTNSNNHFNGCLRDAGDGQLATVFSQIASSPIPAGACVTLLPPPSNAPVPIVVKSLNESNVSWRGSLTWKYRPGSMAYVSVTRGYKAGGFPTLAALTPDQFDPIKQESVVSSEAGFRSVLLDRRLEIDGAGFYYDYTGKQLIGYKTTPFGNLPGFISIPKSHVDGVELDSTLKPFGGLSLMASATYLHAIVDSALVTNNPFNVPVDIKGESFPNTPRWQLTGDAQYSFPLWGGYLGTIGGSTEFRTSTSAAFGGGPYFQMPSYALLDLRAEIEGDHLSVMLWGRNVTNRFYVLNISHVVDTVARTTGMPATYGITVGYRY